LSVISIIVLLPSAAGGTFQSIAVRFPDAAGLRGRREARGAIFYARREVPSPQEIQQRIEAALPGSRAEVIDTTGTADHFEATVVSEAFAGLSRIEQHRLVYGALQDDIGGAIHALALKTRLPEQTP
jgi:stress-induced morphogen